MQDAIVEFLSSPDSYPTPPTNVDVVETHGAMVFLAGQDVYKIKREVRFDYMDFSTLDRREAVCRRELEINRPHAPEIYKGVVPITQRPDGHLEIGGHGTPIEWAIHMHRFPEEAVLRHIASTGGISPELGKALGDMVAAYHRSSPERRLLDAVEPYRHVVEEIADFFTTPGLGTDVAVGARSQVQWLRSELPTHAPVLARRNEEGFVRRCHGDLHSGNIVVLGGRPIPFDALEFDEALATIDPLYDLAFLLMDLAAVGQRQAASLVFNRYLWRRDALSDIEALAALPMFMALRAAIRSMVGFQRAALMAPGRVTEAHQTAETYLELASSFTRRGPARLIAVGGLSGTGKSTVAATIAPLLDPIPGALHLRSDLERKALLGVEETDRLPQSAYDMETSARVYARMLEKAERALAAGCPVVVDAVFSKPVERAAIEDLVKDRKLDFQGIWLEADPEVLKARVAARRGDASDATPEVVDFQLSRDSGDIAWTRIDAAGSKEDTRQRVVTALGLELLVGQSANPRNR